MTGTTTSRKIIVIDDQPEIHEAFQKILSLSSPKATDELSRLRAAVKGDTPAATRAPSSGYILESAFQGEEGFKKIASARQAHEPFSVAFIDMRMPPGWDGLRTIKEIWNTDPDIQIVICTAYSDQPWSEIDELADKSDRILVLKKPFDTVEIRRMASTLSAKWRLARQAEAQRAAFQELTAAQTDLSTLHRAEEIQRVKKIVENALREVTTLLDTPSLSTASPKPQTPSSLEDEVDISTLLA